MASPKASGPGPTQSQAPNTSDPSTTSNKQPSRTNSVRFSDPDYLHTSQHPNEASHAANHSAAESSADEVTPIVSRERGRGGSKSRKYDAVGQLDHSDDGDSGPENRDGAIGTGRSKGGPLDPKGLKVRTGKKNAGNSKSSRSNQDGRTPGQEEEQKDTGSGPLTAIGRWVRNIADKYGSVELDNKGSVARDHLALERTFLAWLRTSLAFASIGIAVTQLFRLNTTINEGKGYKPDNPVGSVHLRQLGKPLGATFLGIAIMVLLMGGRRYFESQYWIIRGKFPASRGSIFILTFVAVALIITSLVLVCVVDPSVFEKR